MKPRLQILSLLIIILCFLAVPGIHASAEAANTNNGWKYIDNNWYYYQNGQKVSGWKTINKNTYYFDSKNKNAMVTGFKKIKKDGKYRYYYFMDKNYVKYSSSREGQMLTGFKKIKKDGQYRFFYFIDKNYVKYSSSRKGEMLTGFKIIKVKGVESVYYFADHRYKKAPLGTRLLGFKTVGGKRYFFANSKYKSAPLGARLQGFHIISGKVYYFDKNGVQQKDWASKHVIVIDPGHSSEIPDGQVPIGPGSDEMKDADNYGTEGIATGVHEYELNLQVSLKLRDALVKKGYKVVMVRTTNKGVYSCVDRANVANKNNAAVFLRVHANAMPKDHSKTGALAINITKNNPFIPRMYKQSRLLSEKILGSYVKATGCYNEGIMEVDTMIANNWSKVPTTLIELGYMTNEKEDKLMQTGAYQKKMVNGLVNGIDAYFKATIK